MIDIYTGQTGIYVERYVLDLLEDLYDELYVPSTQDQDLYEGTDCFVDGVPIDITLNQNKRSMKFLDRFILEGLTVNVFLRFGCGRRTFCKPVLVIQFETYGLRERMEICDLIEDNLNKEILSDILGLYKK